MPRRFMDFNTALAARRRQREVKSLARAVRATQQRQQTEQALHKALQTWVDAQPVSSMDMPWLSASSGAATALDLASALASEDGCSTISREDIVTARVLLADAARAEIMKGYR